MTVISLVFLWPHTLHVYCRYNLGVSIFPRVPDPVCVLQSLAGALTVIRLNTGRKLSALKGDKDLTAPALNSRELGLSLTNDRNIWKEREMIHSSSTGEV